MVLPNQQNSVDHNKSEIDEFVSNAFEQNCVLLLGDTPVELQTYSSFACINNSFCFSRFEKAIPKLAKPPKLVLSAFVVLICKYVLSVNLVFKKPGEASENVEVLCRLPIAMSGAKPMERP